MIPPGVWPNHMSHLFSSFLDSMSVPSLRKYLWEASEGYSLKTEKLFLKYPNFKKPTQS